MVIATDPILRSPKNVAVTLPTEAELPVGASAMVALADASTIPGVRVRLWLETVTLQLFLAK